MVLESGVSVGRRAKYVLSGGLWTKKGVKWILMHKDEGKEWQEEDYDIA